MSTLEAERGIQTLEHNSEGWGHPQLNCAVFWVDCAHFWLAWLEVSLPAPSLKDGMCVKDVYSEKRLAAGMFALNAGSKWSFLPSTE